MALETNAHRSALHSSGSLVWVRNPHKADRACKKQKPMMAQSRKRGFEGQRSKLAELVAGGCEWH